MEKTNNKIVRLLLIIIIATAHYYTQMRPLYEQKYIWFLGVTGVFVVILTKQ